LAMSETITSRLRAADGECGDPIPEGIELIRTVDWKAEVQGGQLDIEVKVEFDRDGTYHASVHSVVACASMEMIDLMVEAAGHFNDWRAEGIELALAELKRDIEDQAEKKRAGGEAD